MKIALTKALSVDETGTEIARGDVIPARIYRVNSIAAWCESGADFEILGTDEDSDWVPTVTGLHQIEGVTGDGPYFSVRAPSGVGTMTIYLEIKGE